MRYILLSILVIFLWVERADAKASALAEKASQAYAAKDFENARLLYDSLVSLGFTNSDLYYNLANCYYKLNETGESILYYEKALKLDPGDEDIQFNLQLANLNVVSKIEEREPLVFEKFINRFFNSFSLPFISWMAIAFIWISVITSLLYLFSRKPSVRKTGFILMLTFLMFFFVALALSVSKNAIQNDDKEAILMATNTYIKSAPDENSTDLFILHEGVKMKIEDELSSWTKVKIADGKVGWIEKSKIEQI